MVQALRLKEIERRLMEDTRRKKHDWERDVEKMREEFLTMHPCDEPYRAIASSSIVDSDDLTTARRRGSTDVLDSKQMKTMFLEYPDAGNVLLLTLYRVVQKVRPLCFIILSIGWLIRCFFDCLFVCFAGWLVDQSFD